MIATSDRRRKRAALDLMLIDGHNDLPWAHREALGCDLDAGSIALPRPELHTDLPRLSAGGVKGQFWSVYVPSTLPEPQAVVATLEQWPADGP